MKLYKLDTGDHHHQEDVYVCLADDKDIEELGEAFHKDFPYRCAAHNDYDSDPEFGCEDCMGFDSVATYNLERTSIENTGWWNQTFQAWLIKYHGAQPAERPDTYTIGC